MRYKKGGEQYKTAHPKNIKNKNIYILHYIL